MTDLAAIRTVSETDDIHVIEGRLAYKGPFDGRDTFGTWFSARTDWGLDLHPAGIPVLFNHGFDADFGLRPIGMTAPTASFRTDEDGFWVQMQLDKRHRYYATRVRPLLDKGGLGVSQGSAEHSLDIDARTGEVRAWPLHEISLTPTESNPFNVVAAARTAEVISIIASRAEMSSESMNDLPDSAFAYIEPGGEKDEDGKTTPRSLRHFPIHDAAHVRNALARLSQSEFGDKARAKVEKAAKKFGIEVGERSGDVVTLGFDGTRGIQTFSDIIAAAEVSEELPEAFDTLTSAIYSAIYATDSDFNPLPIEEKRAAIQTSLDQFRDHILNVIDKAPAGRSGEMILAAIRAARLNAVAAAVPAEPPPEPPAAPEPPDAARTAEALPTITVVERVDAEAERTRLLALAARTGTEVARKLTG